MRSWLALSLALLLATAVPAAAGQDNPAPPAGGQPGGGETPPAQPAKDAQALQFLKELKPQIGKQADADAKAAIKKLLEIWKDKEVTDATKKVIPDYLESYARLEKQALVAVDAIDALGELGAEAGAPPVLALLDRALKAKEPSVDIYGSCLRSLKKLADPRKSTVGALIDLLKHKSDDVVGKGADAMAGYKDAPGKVRKELVEELIKNTEGVASSAEDPKNATQVRKWNIIQHSVLESLKALTGQPFKKMTDARKWYNDHKKDKTWD